MFLGYADDFGTESARRTVLLQPKLSQVLSRTSLLLGNTFKLTGTITPSFAGEEVILEHKKGAAGTWGAVTPNWVMASSGATLTREYTLKPTSKGEHFYRLRIAEVPNVHLGFTTAARTVTVN